MRIAIPVLFTALIMLFLCGCDNSISEEETTDLNEAVIQTIDKSKPVTSGNLITKTKTDSDDNIHIEYYDSVGNLVENFVWDKNDTAVSHSIIRYTPDNKIQKKEEIFPGTTNSTIETYQYDSEGNISSKNVSEYKENKLYKSTNYDDDGNILSYSVSEYTGELRTKVEKFDSADTLIEYYTYEYNQSGDMTKYSTFDNNGKIIKYTLFEYSESHLLLSEKYYNADDSIKNYNVYIYNDDGTKKSVISYDAQGNLLSENYF